MSVLKLRSPLSTPRREDGTLLPAVLVAVLALMLVLQLALTRDSALPDADPAPLAPMGAVTSPPRVAASPVIDQRPLFSPTRSGGSARATAGGDGAASPLGGAIVAGSVRARGIARAMLRLPDGAIQVLPLGGVYLGWRLVGLGPDGAQFRRAGESMTIPYGSALAAAPAKADDEEDQEQ